MQIRHLSITGYRGIKSLEFSPGPRTVLIGPNNAGKSTVLEALDLLLSPGLGRPRPALLETDYFGRDPSAGFTIEATIGDLTKEILASAREHLEGWKAGNEELVPDPDGEGIEAVVRIRVRGTSDFDLLHEFAKDESNGARLSPGFRARLGWLFDGRTRDPVRQLAFYQGGLLDRLFGDVDVGPAVAVLRGALETGAADVNADGNVSDVLQQLANDFQSLGVIEPGQAPQFEIGGVSERELLKSLQLALPGIDCQLPIFRQGRGVQRLVLVSTLLRLGTSAGRPVIGAFEEPEEALEPLRQTQMARMLLNIVDGGGQVFVVTHSPEIARAFLLEDFVLLDQGATNVRLLRKELSGPVRQKYERWLDRVVVRALFARFPLLVEGPSDRTVIETFWRKLAAAGLIRSAEQLGVDVVNCEGAPEMPMMARCLKEAGKLVIAWAEQDVPTELAKLQSEGNCAVMLLHDPAAGRQNLEQAIAQSASFIALTRGLELLATGRGYTFEQQRDELVSRSEGIDSSTREKMKSATSLDAIFNALGETRARDLIAKALATKAVTPFEMKGARQGRVLAEALVADADVPPPFAKALIALEAWIVAGATGRKEITMAP